MLSLDLIPRDHFRESRFWPVARWAVILLTICHLTALGWAWLFAWHRSAAVAGLAAEERRLQAELAALGTPADQAALAGAVLARGAWFAARARDPVRFLRMIEAGRPPDGLVRETELTPAGGLAVVSVPDQGAAAAWFQHLTAAGTRRAEIDPAPTPDGGVSVRWSWTD